MSAVVTLCPETGGIIALLDEAVTLFVPTYSPACFQKSTHETLSQKLYEKFKNHKRFTKPKLSRTAFTINIMLEMFISTATEENTKSSKSSIATRFKGVLEAIRIS
ncbi:hypothetical protein HU200_046280 [Digitaria exilis]|uniref:Uncharacterized protein n=1 Tax=Digitaria exilis TaxID=1010633 RepID=A0A835EB73_9POAL|nr:hypothetical protein HU200_046280 [Digitaria exilis]